MNEPVRWHIYDGDYSEVFPPEAEPASEGDTGEQAGLLARAVFEFMQEIRPKGGVFGPGLETTLPPYEHRLGATRGSAFTVREMLPRWKPPRPAFRTYVAPVPPFPVSSKRQEIPEAFRRRSGWK